MLTPLIFWANLFYQKTPNLTIKPNEQMAACERNQEGKGTCFSVSNCDSLLAKKLLCKEKTWMKVSPDFNFRDVFRKP